MRYLFRGLIRDTGQPVEGHVEAATEEAAYTALSENNIITEALRIDPKSLDLSPMPAKSPEINDAIESALDISSKQVAFDDLADRYKGKMVWVIDRDKIRNRVAQVVDQALAISAEKAETSAQTRERVVMAIKGMFNDNKNIASQTPASSVAMDQQLNKLGTVVKQMEGLLAAMAVAVRQGGGGSSVPRRMALEGHGRDNPQYGVLLEIFKYNMNLMQSLTDPKPPDAAPQPATGGTGGTP